MVFSVREVGSAALQGLLTGLWVAAGELPTARRRLARTGATLGLSAVGSIRDWAFADEGKKPERQDIDGRRKLVVTGVVTAVGIGVMVGRKQVENRWLARLERDGHAYPHRALGVRMGALSFAGTLVTQLARRRF
ncbi:hypothetical protein [Actinoplanes sp. NPDC051494]|uniref:hypothetical protein n=1 Tax=Actinoplanes sp. NPDC051494 TaxID=3363907 RepID=UPI0037BB75DA